MYQQFFNFTEAPFSIAPDPHFVYMSARHQEGLAHLLYGITQSGGFVALTGEVGTGKTTLCQCLLQQLPEEVDLALVLNPKLNAVELLATICDELSIDYNKYRLTLKHLVDTLNHHLLEAHAKGRRTVLMIDEAQNLSFPVLEQIRLLTNLETSKQKLLQIILVGQPELQELLASPQLRQLNQRITARYHLLPLNRTETGLYIKHRLAVSHGDRSIFKPSAIKAIHCLSGGIPRLVNLICDRALLGAYVHNSRRVSTAIVNRAAREIDSLLLVKQQRRRRMLLLAILLFSAMAAGYYHWPAPFASLHEKTLPPTPLSIQEPAIPDNTARPVPAETKETEDDAALPAEKEKIETNTAEQPAANLYQYLQKTELNLPQVFVDLLSIWDLPPATTQQCEELPVDCLADRATWRELIGLNRPVILEFALDSEQKRHLLLVGVKKGRPVFRHQGRDIDFSLHEVLTQWQGYYLLLWQSSPSGVDLIYPGQQSAAVLWLREQLDALLPAAETTRREADYFDSALQKRVIAFQQNGQLQADGIVGPRTMIHLQNLTVDQYGPRLRISD